MVSKAKKIAKRILRGSPHVTEKLTQHSADLAEMSNKLDETRQLLRSIQVPDSRSTILKTNSNEIVTKLFNGQKIYLSLDDLSLTPHVALDGIWEHEITSAWVSVAKPSSVVLDIGANFGYYGLIASQSINMKKSKVVYFEPNAQLTPLISKTLALNWLVENSSVEQVAISDKVGTAKLNVLKDYVGSSSLHSIDHLNEYLGDSMRIEVTRTVEVPTNTIDEYCRQQKIEQVDLIKLDVEGFEQFAYMGMRKTVKKSPDPVLFIEFTAKSYDGPEAFYEIIKGDFGNVYLINDDGSFTDASKIPYKKIEGLRDDWIMLVFSKRKLSR